MKKFILGCVLILSGVLGFSGWMIACTNYGSGYTETLSYLYGSDWIIALLFIGMFVAGLIISFIEIKKDGRNPKI